MKKILFITTTPSVGGNGDALIEKAIDSVKAEDVSIRRIDIRKKDIHPCNACYACSRSGKCVQKDDFNEVLVAIHECDGLVVEAPVYYNCIAAQALTVINRFCCTFAYKDYVLGPKKKVAIMLTCTGSSVDEMKHHVENIVTLPSISRSIIEAKTEVFTNCESKTSCRESIEYMNIAEEIGRWVIQ